MINFKAFRSGPVVILIFLASLPCNRLLANGELSGPNSETTIVENGSADLGVGKFFKLPFHISVSVRGGYDDNVSTQAFDRQGSAFVNANLAVNYNFGSPRTQLSLASNFGFTDYLDSPQGVNNDFAPNVTILLSHKWSPRLTFALNSYFTYQQQPDFNNFVEGLNRRQGSYFYTTDKFSATFLWKPRFSTVTHYTFVALAYDDSSVGSFEDRTEHTLGNEFRFLVLPTTSLVAEYRIGLVAYANTSSQSRDSLTHFFLGGVDHSFSPRITLSVRGGMEYRTYDNFGDRADPYGEGTLTYALGPHLNLSWINRYSLEEPDVPGSPSRVTFRTGLTGRYNLTARIVAGFNAFWEHDENDGQVSFFFVSPGFAEDVFTLGGSVRYAMNHTWGLEAGYDFYDVESELTNRGYYRNRIYGGLNFQF
jgi:putative beta-barrel porin BBP2